MPQPADPNIITSIQNFRKTGTLTATENLLDILKQTDNLNPYRVHLACMLLHYPKGVDPANSHSILNNIIEKFNIDYYMSMCVYTAAEENGLHDICSCHDILCNLTDEYCVLRLLTLLVNKEEIISPETSCKLKTILTKDFATTTWLQNLLFKKTLSSKILINILKHIPPNRIDLPVLKKFFTHSECDIKLFKEILKHQNINKGFITDLLRYHTCTDGHYNDIPISKKATKLELFTSILTHAFNLIADEFFSDITQELQNTLKSSTPDDGTNQNNLNRILSNILDLNHHDKLLQKLIPHMSQELLNSIFSIVEQDQKEINSDTLNTITSKASQCLDKNLLIKCIQHKSSNPQTIQIAISTQDPTIKLLLINTLLTSHSLITTEEHVKIIATIIASSNIDIKETLTTLRQQSLINPFISDFLDGKHIPCILPNGYINDTAPEHKLIDYLREHKELDQNFSSGLFTRCKTASSDLLLAVLEHPSFTILGNNSAIIDDETYKTKDQVILREPISFTEVFTNILSNKNLNKETLTELLRRVDNNLPILIQEMMKKARGFLMHELRKRYTEDYRQITLNCQAIEVLIGKPRSSCLDEINSYKHELKLSETNLEFKQLGPLSQEAYGAVLQINKSILSFMDEKLNIIEKISNSISTKKQAPFQKKQEELFNTLQKDIARLSPDQLQEEEKSADEALICKLKNTIFLMIMFNQPLLDETTTNAMIAFVGGKDKCLKLIENPDSYFIKIKPEMDEQEKISYKSFLASFAERISKTLVQSSAPASPRLRM